MILFREVTRADTCLVSIQPPQLIQISAHKGYNFNLFGYSTR